MAGELVLEMKKITKTFPGVKALDAVSFDLLKGEVHALVGENGAGKSTLMKVLGSLYKPDIGEIFLDGKHTIMSSPSDSLREGISIIYQEFNLAPTLSIGENIFLGKELIKGHARVLDRAAMSERALEVLKTLGQTGLDGNTLVGSLSVAKQQIVEIGKALYNDVKILVMDEPTSVLTIKETNALFRLILDLKTKGISVIYISHRIEEVQEISDRITVLRDGKYITTINNRERNVSKDEIVRLMVGRELTDYFPRRTMKPTDDVVLEVRGLTKKGQFENISFTLRRGEVLGFSGLIGAGRTELMKALFGAVECTAGEVLINKKKIVSRSPFEAIKHGISLVPEDRKQEGLVLLLTMSENICLPNYEQISIGGCVLTKKKKNFVERFLKSLNIRPLLPDRMIKDFSGGNQQKAVISKWLAKNPSILILDEPTRGIDVGAKEEIYQLMNRLTEQGVSIIMVSSEMLEVIGMCDRVIVMCEGKITGEFNKDIVDQEKIMMAAAGL